MNNRLPNLLVIGAMKSGTTSLHDYLSKHPDIFMSSPKEIHYYADANYKKWAKEKYMNFFKTEKKYAGTSPQSYTKCHNKFYQNIPERIYKDTPDVKLIYIVRDPIERYKSHVLESYHCDPLEDIKYSQESENYLKTSMYGMQLKAYLKYFDLGQIYVLALEDLQENPLVEMNQLFSFLGVSKLNDASLFESIKNTASSKKIPRSIKDHLLFRIGMRINEGLIKRIGQKLALRFFKAQLKKPQVDSYELNELKTSLVEDINEFRQITGKKFEQWSI